MQIVSYPDFSQQQTRKQKMVDVAEQPVATEQPATPLSEDPKIVSAVQAHLDAFKDIEDDVTPAAKEAPVETPAEEVVKTPTEEVVATEVPEKVAALIPGQDHGEAVVKAPAETSTLPAAYVRTAKARGWTDEEITNFSKTDPAIAMKTFERMHESRTKEIQEWAEIGRKVRQSPGGASSSVANQPVAAPVQSSSPVPLAPINVQEMVEKYGNKDLIEALAGPVNAAISALGPIVQGAQAAREQSTKDAQAGLAKSVEDFFGDKTMKGYESFYGPTNFAEKTPTQIEAFKKVLDTADALRAGAAYQGRELSVQEALTLAHDSVASGVKETIIRGQIQTKVQKRNAGITLRPTAQGRRSAGGPPQNRQELVGRTEDRLAKAFG
jgi:hypothetical protein